MNYFECCQHCVPPKRYPGCSGPCPDYKKARAKYDADKARTNKSASIKYYINEKSTKTKDNIAKYMKRCSDRRRSK